MNRQQRIKRWVIGIILLYLAPVIMVAQTEAVDDSGRRVLLYEDYSWAYAPPDIRNLYWGMSIQQVMETEQVRLIPDGNTLFGMNISAFGMTGMMFFEFDQDELVLAGYLFIENHPDGDAYLDDYRAVVETLSERYGEPAETITEWTGNEREDMGEAFLDGALQLRTEWETQRSSIACGLLNDRDLFGLLVGYEFIERH